MKSFFIAPPVGGGRSRKANDPPLVALRSRRCRSGCVSSTAGDCWVGRRRGGLTTPFPSAPHRTGLTRFPGIRLSSGPLWRASSMRTASFQRPTSRVPPRAVIRSTCPPSPCVRLSRTRTVGSEEARRSAGLRPPLKLDVRFSRIQLSQRRFNVAGAEKESSRSGARVPARRTVAAPGVVSNPGSASA